jgi:dihydrofolate synthase/folylpolyglutamate synthase
MDRASEIKQHLFSLHTRGIKYDLDRMKYAASRLDNPQHASPCFHVAGSNGKGSVCAFLESALRRLGFKTGLYTSPHLVTFEERFMINGAPVAERAVVDVFDYLQPTAESLHLTFFETATLMAFELFKRENVEWAVYETGLGGRLDATNVVMPQVSIITPVAIDHREYLGNDLLSIAGEKLGIVKHRTPLVMAQPESTVVCDLALIHALRNETTAVFVDTHEADDTTCGPDGAHFSWHGQHFSVSLRGEYQVFNALLALNGLKNAGFYNLGTIAEGIKAAWLPGRFQVVTIKNKTVVFDVGHNPHAAHSFCRAIASRFINQPVVMVLGIMKDKDAGAMLPDYAGVAGRLILTAPSTERAARPEDLLAALPGDFGGQAEIKPDVAAAVNSAMQGPEEVVCIAGSFFTVGEGMTVLGFKPYG